MPIAESTANLYIQLGIAGATLLILLVFVILLFKLFGKINTNGNSSQNSRIDKLCDKIDSLITSYSENTSKINEVLLTNDKDQKETIKLLKNINSLAIENNRRISRVDDRTYRCLGNEKGVDKK